MRVGNIYKAVLIGIPILLIIVTAVAVAVLKYIDFNQYKPLIAEEVRQATGRDLAITGDLTLDLALTPGVVVDGVTLSNAGWGSRPDMVRIERLEARFALASLVFGNLAVERIELTGVDVLLETDRQGHANFDFRPPGAEPKELEPKEVRADIGAALLIHEAEIRDSRLTYMSAETGATYSTVIQSLTLRSDGPDEPSSLAYEGDYNGVPVRANARLGTLASLVEPSDPWPVDLTLDTSGAVVTAHGTIANPLTAGGFDLAINARGDQLGDVSQLAGVEMPPLGAFSISGQLIGDAATAVTLAGLKAQLGTSDVSGEMSLKLTGGQPVIKANLAFERFDLAVLGARADTALHNAVTAVSLKDGKLEIESFNATLAGATVSVKGAVTEPFAGRGLDLAISLNGIQVGDLSDIVGARVPALGAYNLSTRITGDFSSTIALSGLKGQLGDSDIAGEVTFLLAGKSLEVDARLVSGKIDLSLLDARVTAPLQDVAAVFSVKDNKLDIESFKANLSGAAITVKGQIENPAAGTGLDLEVDVAGDRIDDLSGLARVELPALGAYSLSTRLTGDSGSAIKLTGLKAQTGGADLSGEVTLSQGGAQQAIDAKLESRQIDLAALGIGVNATLRDTVTSLSLKGSKLDLRSLKTNLAGAVVTVNGAVADAATFGGLDLSVAATGDQFVDLSELVGGEVPSLGGYTVSMRVTGDLASTIDISGLAAHLGGSDVSAVAKVTLSGKHPAIDARLVSDKIDLAALGAGNAPLRGTVAILSLRDQTLFIESIEANLSGAAIMVEGTIAEPVKARGLELLISGNGERFADLSELAGREMPALGSYAISTRMTGDATATIRLSDVAARVGESNLAGSASVRLTGEQPFIDADLSSNMIDLAILGDAAGDVDGVGQQEAKESKPDRIFPDDPLLLQGLKTVNAKLRFEAAAVTGYGPPLRNAVVNISLRDGLLDVGSFNMEGQYGMLAGAVRIDGRKEPAGLVARVALHKVDVATVLEETDLAGAVEGKVNFDFDVTGHGSSVRRIMASLDGEVSLAMGQGRIRSRTLQQWVGGATQIFTDILTLNVGGYIAVNCVLGVFDIEKGVATSRGFLLDTDVAAFVGNGSITLETETLDMTIVPQVKRATLSTTVPVHIRGTLANPEYSLDNTAVARRVGGLLGGLVYPPALILGLGELGTLKDGDCAGRAESADGKTTPEQTQPTTEQQPSTLPGKILKGTGEGITRGLERLFGQ